VNPSLIRIKLKLLILKQETLEGNKTEDKIARNSTQGGHGRVLAILHLEKIVLQVLTSYISGALL